MAEHVLEKFLRYVVIDTQSKENSDTYPSTAKQYDLLNKQGIMMKRDYGNKYIHRAIFKK